MRLRRAWGHTLVLALVASTLWAQGAVGPQFQVNEYTTSDQDQASAALAADGGFVVVWRSEGSEGSDDSETSVQGRLYTADGTPQGPQIQVNSFTTGVQTGARAAVGPGGDFIVTWFSDGSAGSDADWSIQAQRFDALGVPLGGEFQVNSYTTSFQYSPSVAVADDGRFVVAWASEGSTGDDTSGWSIQARRFDASGGAQGPEFQVNAYTSGSQTDVAVAMRPDGDFVVVWDGYGSSGSDNSENSIQGRRFAADGTPQGSEIQINTYTTGFQWGPSVAMNADGDFVVVWTSTGSAGSDTSGRSVHARRFAADGTPQGGQFQVNTYTTGNQSLPTVAAAAGGEFVITWTSEGSPEGDVSYASVQARRYAANGMALGPQFQVNAFTTGEQQKPTVAAAGGSVLIVWESDGSGGTDDSGFSVQGQRFEPILLFVDGFESGDTSAWSTTVP